MAEEERRLAGEIGRVLDECRLSHAVHPRKLKELSALRSASAADAHPGLCFFAAFTRAVTPLFDFPRRTVSSERAVRFVSAFAARRDEKDAVVCDAFLEEFLRFLLVAAAAAHRPARFRACQIISEVMKILTSYWMDLGFSATAFRSVVFYFSLSKDEVSSFNETFSLTNCSVNLWKSLCHTG